MHLEGPEVSERPRTFRAAGRLIFFLEVMHLDVFHQVIYFNKIDLFWGAELTWERMTTFQFTQGEVLGHMAGQNPEVFKSNLADSTTQWTVSIGVLYAGHLHLIDWRLMTLATVEGSKEVSVVLVVVMV